MPRKNASRKNASRKNVSRKNKRVSPKQTLMMPAVWARAAMMNRSRSRTPHPPIGMPARNWNNVRTQIEDAWSRANAEKAAKRSRRSRVAPRNPNEPIGMPARNYDWKVVKPQIEAALARSSKKSMRRGRVASPRNPNQPIGMPARNYDWKVVKPQIEAALARSSKKSMRRGRVASPRNPNEPIGMPKRRGYRMSINKDMFAQLVEKYNEHNDSWFSSDKDKLSKPEIDMMVNYLIGQLKNDEYNHIINTDSLNFIDKNMTPQLLEELASAGDEKLDPGYLPKEFEKKLENILIKHGKNRSQIRDARFTKLLNKSYGSY
jgi:hypothetical protein